MVRQIGLILGIGIVLVISNARVGAEPLDEPNPLPQVDASSSSALDIIEVNNRDMENFFPANPQGTATNYFDPTNTRSNEFDPLGRGFKLDFGNNLRSRRELDASMSSSDDSDNTKVRLLIDVTELDDSSDRSRKK